MQLLRRVQEEEFGTELAVLRAGRPISKRSPLLRLSPMLASDGLLRVKGCLQNSQFSYNAKHPIIIPRGHLALLLLRFQHRFLKHGR